MNMVTITDSAIIVDVSGSEYKRQVLNTAINAIAITDTKKSPLMAKKIGQESLILAIVVPLHLNMLELCYTL
jgi:hypothetical protein